MVDAARYLLRKSNGSTPPAIAGIAQVSSPMVDAATITHALGGEGRMARCPAHDDRTPSLSVTDGDDGRVLVHCHAGCAQDAVLDAIQSATGILLRRPRKQTQAQLRKAMRRKTRWRPPKLQRSKEKPKLDLARWHDAKPATVDHWYFSAFDRMYSEVREEGNGTLLVPYHDDADGVIVGVEIIPPGGLKSKKSQDDSGRFPAKKKPVIAGSKKHGAIHGTTSGTTDQIALAEGVRTAWAVRAATGCTAYSAGGMSNLIAAARTVRKLHPDAEIHGYADQYPLDVAEQAMSEAMRAVGGKLVTPGFKRPSKARKDFHDLLRMKNGAAKIRRRMAKAEAVNADELLAPERGPYPLDRTEIANAERFVEEHRSILRHIPKRGWLEFDGRCWVSDAEAVKRLAIITIKRLAQAAIEGEIDERRLKWAAGCSRNAHLRAIIEIAASDERVQAKLSEFDANPWLFNCQNGTLDLRSGKLLPHSADDLITKVSPVAFDPDAQCPRWLKFHHRISDANQEIVDFKQRFYGYCLTGDTREQKFVHAFGPGGNGKTTEVETVARVLGDYAATADIETFLAQRNAGITSDIVRLAGARFVVTSEVPANRRVNEARIKLLTGGDKIVARGLYQSEIEFSPQLKLIIFGNHKLQITETTHAMWRRALLVDYPVTISPGERDDDLGDKLAVEMPGILNWLLRGCLEWQRRQGLHAPAAVALATDKYRREQDVLGAFLTECCRKAKAGEVAAAALYERYRDWCERNGERPMAAKAFAAAMLERNYAKKRKGTGIFYRGLSFRKFRRKFRRKLHGKM